MSDESDSESSAKSVIEGELTEGSQLARADELLPSTLHVLPLSGRPFFPPHVMPLFIDDAQWLETVKEIGETPHKMVGLVLLRPDAADPPGPRDYHRVGTVVRMHEPNRLEGRIRFVAEGIQRFEIIEWQSASTIQNPPRKSRPS